MLHLNGKSAKVDIRALSEAKTMKAFLNLHRMRPAAFTCILLMLWICCAENNLAQSRDSQDESPVVVKSWRVGKSNIQERVLDVNLEKPTMEYEWEMQDASKQRLFRLRFRRTFYRTPLKHSVPCWSATLNEVTEDKLTGGRMIGYDLMEPGGPGSDYIPRETWASLLCPVAKPKALLDDLLYPIKRERIFLIEEFSLSLLVTDYEYREKENTLNKLSLRIKFKNN
jgi:hypothetical protein